jgi:hypothetical protein
MKKKLSLFVFVFTLIYFTQVNVFAYGVKGIPLINFISYSYHSTLNSFQRAAINSARTTWNDAAGNITISVNSTDTTGTVVVGDTNNTVAVLDYSSLGYSITSNACTPLVLNSNGKIINFDVLFNSLKSWTSDSTTGLDFQGIATHELGHTLGLNEVYGLGYYNSTSTVPTMYAYSSCIIGGPSGIDQAVSYYFRTLTQDDISGKSYIASQI